jgi:hypothetical protein
MINREKRKKLIIFIPLTSIILAVLSLVIPTVYVSYYSNFAYIKTYIWIFGLDFTSFIGFNFLPNYQLLYSFLSSTIIILAIYSLIQNIRYIIQDRKKYDYIRFWLAWIICGVFLIFASFLYWRIYPSLFMQEVTKTVKGYEISTGLYYNNIWYYYFFRKPIFLTLSGLIIAISGITYKALSSFPGGIKTTQKANQKEISQELKST